MIQNQGKCTLRLLLMCLNIGGGAGGGWFLEFALPGGNELTRGGVALEELGGG